MRRADRLFHIVQVIRGRRLTTAHYLAERMEVSDRTIYRDIADLQEQGVPIEGEAGVGYRLGPGYDLPPMMFTSDEARALVGCVRLALPWVDPELARFAEDGIGKILSVLPSDSRITAEAIGIYAGESGLHIDALRTLQVLRESVQGRSKIHVHYMDLSERPSERVLRPLGCFYWGKVWTLSAWCEKREDFRTFRVDRITKVSKLEERFRDEPGRTLADLLRMSQGSGGTPPQGEAVELTQTGPAQYPS